VAIPGTPPKEGRSTDLITTEQFVERRASVSGFQNLGDALLINPPPTHDVYSRS
jgi:hypothetical protein